MISKIVPAKPVKAPKHRTSKKNTGTQSKNGTDGWGKYDKYMEELKAELKANIARQKEIQREMTELFFQRMLEEE